jgi:hypothetical protein
MDHKARPSERLGDPPIATADIKHTPVLREHLDECADDPRVPLGPRPVGEPFCAQLSIEGAAQVLRV